MEESQFYDLVDHALLTIEEAVEDSGFDIDIENVGGVLTLIFPNESQIIINRQTPTRQIWVASKSGGYHLNYDSDNEIWEQDGIELFALLSRECSEQAGTEINLSE